MAATETPIRFMTNLPERIPGRRTDNLHPGSSGVEQRPYKAIR